MSLSVDGLQLPVRLPIIARNRWKAVPLLGGTLLNGSAITSRTADSITCAASAFTTGAPVIFHEISVPSRPIAFLARLIVGGGAAGSDAAMIGVVLSASNANRVSSCGGFIGSNPGVRVGAQHQTSAPGVSSAGTMDRVLFCTVFPTLTQFTGACFVRGFNGTWTGAATQTNQLSSGGMNSPLYTTSGGVAYAGICVNNPVASAKTFTGVVAEYAWLTVDDIT